MRKVRTRDKVSMTNLIYKNTKLVGFLYPAPRTRKQPIKLIRKRNHRLCDSFQYSPHFHRQLCPVTRQRKFLAQFSPSCSPSSTSQLFWISHIREQTVKKLMRFLLPFMKMISYDFMLLINVKHNNDLILPQVHKNLKMSQLKKIIRKTPLTVRS